MSAITLGALNALWDEINGGPGPVWNGVRVFESEHALVPGDPKRKHNPRRNNRKVAYHRRVQKKWTKRWGRTFVPGAWQTTLGLFVHPVIAKQLKAHTATQAVDVYTSPTHARYR